MGVNTNNHIETNGTFIETQREDNIQTRLGMRAYMNNSNPINKDSSKEFQPFIEANWIHYKKNFSVLMDGESNKPKEMKDLGEIKLGTEIKINTNQKQEFSASCFFIFSKILLQNYSLNLLNSLKHCF